MKFRIDPEFESYLPRPSKERYNRLAVKIELEGCLPGALVVANINGDRILVDGHTALSICKEKKLPIPDPVIHNFPNRESALEWMIEHQSARRNMTDDAILARRESVAKLRSEGKTLQAIAEETGTSLATVRRDLEGSVLPGGGKTDDHDETTENTANGDNTGQSGVQKVVGKDGKQYPAKKAKILCNRCQRCGETKGCSMCAELRKKKADTAKNRKDNKAELDAKAGPATDEPTDSLGTVLPKNCRDAFLDPWIQETIGFLEEINERVRMQKIGDGMRKRAKHYPYFIAGDVVDGVNFIVQYSDEVIKHLKENRPAAVCPSCEGKRCVDCKQSGLVPQARHKELKGKK